jgi:hypothetical protein
MAPKRSAGRPIYPFGAIYSYANTDKDIMQITEVKCAFFALPS